MYDNELENKNNYIKNIKILFYIIKIIKCVLETI